MKKPTTPTETPHSTTRGIVMMVLSVGAFTVNSLLLKYFGTLDREIPSLVPLLFRAVAGIMIVAVFFRGRRPTRFRPIFVEKKLIYRGLTGLIGTAAYYWTVPPMGAAKATLYCNTYVLFAAIIAAIWLGEKLNAVRTSWLIAAFVGIGLLTGVDRTDSGGILGMYELVALVGAVSAACTVVLIRQLVAEHSSGTIFLAQCVWVLIPIAFFTVPELGNLKAIDYLLLTVAAVAASYGQLAMNEGYRCLTVAVGASFQMLWPVFTAIGGMLFFAETLLPLQIVGGLLILVAAWRVSIDRARAT